MRAERGRLWQNQRRGAENKARKSDACSWVVTVLVLRIYDADEATPPALQLIVTRVASLKFRKFIVYIPVKTEWLEYKWEPGHLFNVNCCAVASAGKVTVPERQ
jgi:hypothetical protein